MSSIPKRKEQLKESGHEDLCLNDIRWAMDLLATPVSPNRLASEVAKYAGVPYQQAAAMAMLAEEKGIIERQEGGFVSRRRTTQTLLTEDSAYRWCNRIIESSIRRGANLLLDGIPSIGKSSIAATIAAEVETPILYLTHRHETREERAKQAREAGLEPYLLPAFFRTCPTAKGERAEADKEKVERLHNRGIAPRRIHSEFDLRCKDCPYLAKWEFEPDNYDLIIGHYAHANIPWLTTGRAVIFDEEPGEAFRWSFEAQRVREIVSDYLEWLPECEAETKDDLRTMREDYRAIGGLISRVFDQGGIKNESFAIDSDNGHVLGPSLVFALLAGTDLGNRIERTPLGNGAVAVFNKETGKFTLRWPPDLEYAKSVIALDGTPIPEMWENRLGVDLKHRTVLSETERKEYVNDILGYSIFQTSDDDRPYSSGRYVNGPRSRSLLRAISKEEGERPGVISSDAALKEIPEEDVEDSRHFNEIRSLNEFRTLTTGCVLGGPNHGDEKVKMLAALDGYSVERDSDSQKLTFGDKGDPYLHFVREHTVQQALFRFGRDGQGTTIYVDTAAIPDWLVTDALHPCVRRRGELEREIMRILCELGTVKSSKIQDKLDTENPPTLRAIRKRLVKLEEEGLVEKSGKKKGTRWHDAGLADADRVCAVDISH